jgi:hypothetical protein
MGSFWFENACCLESCRGKFGVSDLRERQKEKSNLKRERGSYCRCALVVLSVAQ